MGESESSMDSPITYNPMGDSEETGVTELEVSVSFGRFENDLLAWDKWSAFPTNKYLEEVEKCSTPGSVAQKKAYFEAHYKKIAARKAEQEDQDKQMADAARDPVDSEVQAQGNLMTEFCEAERALDAEKVNDQNAVSGTVLENEVSNSESEMSSDQADEPKDSLDMADERKDSALLIDAEKLNDQNSDSGIELGNEVANSASEMNELKDSLDMVNESKDSMPLIDEVKDESCCKLVSSELRESEEAAAMVKDEAPSLESERVEELPQHIDNARDNVPVDKEEKVTSEKVLKSKKVSTMKKATNTTPLKKKPAPSTPKSSLLSNPKLSRPALSKSTMSESRASSKKEYAISPLVKKKPTSSESRRAAPTSLHMSLRLSNSDCPANSEPAPSTTMRKSVFMEKMGEKDIVKRAFKAFRKDFNRLSSSSPVKPTSASQIPGKETDITASLVGTPQNKIEGVNNVVKNTPQSSQPGLRKTSNSTRLPYTAVGADQKNVKSVSSNYGLRSHDKPDKRKEFTKKLEEKANSKAAERTQFPSKVKKEAEIRRLSHDHNTKVKPISGTAKLKSSLDKKVFK